MSTVRELRTRLTEKQTLYKNSVERANEAQKRIEEKLQQIDQNYIDTLLLENNIDLTIIKTLDLERIKTDVEYRDMVTERIRTGIAKLHTYVEGELNV